MIDKATVEKAIAPLGEGLASDGIGMAVGEIEGNSVTIKLLVGPKTCRECMMPSDMMEQLFQQCIADEGVPGAQVRVVIVEES
jgi:hypothetical protein